MGSAGGGYTRQALAMGYNDKQADLFGAIMGSMEGATEAVGGALTANVGKKFASKGLQAGLGALGLDVTENFLEEAIMEPIQELTKQSIGKNGDWKDITKRMLRSGLDGALTSIIMGGVSAGVGSAVKVATKAQNNEVISQEEIKQALQDINKSEEVDIEKLLVDSFNFQAQDLMQVTEAQQRKDDRLEKVAQDISQDEGLKIRYANLDDDRISQIENSELSENQINNLLKIADKYDLGQKDIQDLIDGTKNGKYEQNQATTTPNNEILNQEQQTIQQEGKQAQNQTSEQQEENKQEVIKKQEITEKNYENIVENAKYISEEEKNNLKDYIKNLDKNDTTLNDFKNFVNEMNNNSKEVYDNILNTTETYSTGRKEKYQKYLNSKTDYDNSALKNALDIIPANNQGRRTKEQWLNVAKQIGTEIANKSNQEIEEIAFRTWQDERPSSKESMNRQGQKFVPFNSDEWINAIYDSVNEQRQYSVDTEQQNQQPVEQTVNYTEKEPVLKYNISDTIETKNKKQTDERVAEILTEPLTQQKPENRKWAILKANLFDKGIVFEDLSKKTKNRELESKWDYSLTSESRAQNAIGNTRYEFEDGKKKQVSKALLDIKEEVGNKTADFQNYMYHLLNIDRMSLQDRFGIENKPVFRKQY